MIKNNKIDPMLLLNRIASNAVSYSALPLESCLIASLIETPLGDMLAIADEKVLYLLEFCDIPDLEHEVKQLQQRVPSRITIGRTHVIDTLEQELRSYFERKQEDKAFDFKTPVFLWGTDFQCSVWQALQKIPFGETRSYKDLSLTLGKPTAFRAVAQANSANRIAILIPCHRVINANSTLGGYSGGLARKNWLLEHEGF